MNREIKSVHMPTLHPRRFLTFQHLQFPPLHLTMARREPQQGQTVIFPLVRQCPLHSVCVTFIYPDQKMGQESRTIRTCTGQTAQKTSPHPKSNVWEMPGLYLILARLNASVFG